MNEPSNVTAGDVIRYPEGPGMHIVLEPIREIANPLTGELVKTDDVQGLAQAILSLKERRNHLSDVITAFTDAAAAQSRLLGQRTFHYEGFTLEVGADTDLEWDVEALLQLRDLGLPEERYNELVTAKVEYRVNGTVARQIAGANPEFAAVIEAAKRRVPKRPSASVKQRR